MSYEDPPPPPPPPPPEGGYPPPPPPPEPEPAAPKPNWFTRHKVITGLGIVAIAGIVAAGVAGGGDDETSTADETTTTVEPAEDEAAEPETTEAPTTTTTEPPTTTTTELPTVGSGVYAVPAEFAPGTYRVIGYWARLDAAQEIIDNDLTSGDPNTGLSLLDVQPTDAFIEISGEAVALANMPKVDPILLGLTEGTYLVGVDVVPSQYRVTPTAGNTAYWARLDRSHEIIDNNLSEGQLIVVVQPGDYALTYTGTLEVMA
jgi:hypothetical protein